MVGHGSCRRRAPYKTLSVPYLCLKKHREKSQRQFCRNFPPSKKNKKQNAAWNSLLYLLISEGKSEAASPKNVMMHAAWGSKHPENMMPIPIHLPYAKCMPHSTGPFFKWIRYKNWTHLQDSDIYIFAMKRLALILQTPFLHKSLQRNTILMVHHWSILNSITDHWFFNSQRIPPWVASRDKIFRHETGANAIDWAEDWDTMVASNASRHVDCWKGRSVEFAEPVLSPFSKRRFFSIFRKSMFFPTFAILKLKLHETSPIRNILKISNAFSSQKNRRLKTGFTSFKISYDMLRDSRQSRQLKHKFVKSTSATIVSWKKSALPLTNKHHNHRLVRKKLIFRKISSKTTRAQPKMTNNRANWDQKPVKSRVMRPL